MKMHAGVSGGGSGMKDHDSLPPHRRLYTFDQDNPYIFTGYRAFLTYRQCLMTICGLHNELLNIWTHLLGFIWGFSAFVWNNAVLFAKDQTQPIVDADGAPTDAAQLETDRFVLNAYLICVQACLLASGLFHLFLPHISEKTSLRWLQLDLLGITFGMLGCYVPGIHFGFYCMPDVRWFYTVVCGFMFVINLLMQLHKDFLSHRWAMKRVLLYACTLGFGLIPVVHWTTLPHDDPEELGVFLPRVLISYALMIIGVAFYISRFPERACPGSFDIFCSSHQWWHTFVLLAFVWWYRSSVTLFEYRQQHPCPAP
ncbi:hypothetical protein PTSG_11052 [Salpingoeca rosetta]|uniref:Uncharacterized protein n=1 Tax=Salpingoeca rosetta (strain ATCC 50818 / BSB-021) TaxID=946362 RepID=F2US02_SALR5|nr:uncharacterized protein PTSG_11052 [Salpingoeca rosetta]EGD80407.1 hypothetical protein PTSG_11052 [Salpingoeca rosetta]|eukprot:XP_004987971.1 hypothetical protein PTSG_11052 [Salpingoeca rosetta]